MKRQTSRFLLIGALAGALLTFLGVHLYHCYSARPKGADPYALAIRDAAFADADEIQPLVTIDPASDMVTWSEDGKKVLLLSWNGTPEAYAEGSAITVNGGDIWTFTDKEMQSWYRQNSAGVKNWTLRLEQLLGLPEGFGATHVTAFWARPEDVVRPACQPDIAKQVSASALDGSELGAFKAWYDGNILFSYFDDAYPWTRLGYTYDWAEGTGEYGLSEFLIRDGAQVEIEYTLSTDEFLKRLSAK